MKTSKAPPPPDPNEPENVSEAIVAWGLDYVVLTSVDRDDLPDQGSNHFAETVRLLKSRKPSMLVEALGKEFSGSLSFRLFLWGCCLDSLNAPFSQDSLSLVNPKGFAGNRLQVSIS